MKKLAADAATDEARNEAVAPRATGARAAPRQRIALLSNPNSTGNVGQLPRIRAFCADHPDVFHYEVERFDQIGEALATIARVKPGLLVINGGDGTVQSTLTELHNGGHFGDTLPPVAVVPSGKTNLIALDLGAPSDPVEALRRLLAMMGEGIEPHLVARELIALSGGDHGPKPVIGMFLGGAGLADVMLYCREKLYPLGLPNGVAHVLAAMALFLRQMLPMRLRFLPPEPLPLSVRIRDGKPMRARFVLLLVTTLDKLLVSSEIGAAGRGSLKFIAVEQRPFSLIRAFAASLAGRLGRSPIEGVHVVESDEIEIEGDRSHVILDGETFRAATGKPIRLTPAQGLSFVRLAA